MTRDPLLHQQLGPYRLSKIVGRGGMGTVYAAEDLSTGKIAAVKALSPLLATDNSFRDRFLSEIESLKKLRHPNIVQLYGFGEQDGQLFYAMELIEGNSLQEELRHGRRFTWREVVQIAIDICAALKHAHDHGIIHRDLKPANLLYTREEQVRLLDFGIAKLFGSTGATTGSVMGTADYMAPEQAEGKAVGPRTDLYSLGSVMYALLAGRPPFLGKSVPEVVHKVRFESPIPVSRLAVDVPIELEQFIDQLLEKNPQKRVPTALAAAHRLKAMEHALSIQPSAQEAAADDVDTSITPPGPSPAPSSSISSHPTVRMHGTAIHHENVNQITVTTTEEDAFDTGPDHFTVVEREGQPKRTSWITWETVGRLGMLIGLLVFAAYLTWYLTRPPSAETLYATIQSQLDEGHVPLTAERDIDHFLQWYPHHAKAVEIQGYQQAIQQTRLQRRLENKAARRQTGRSDVEQLYLDALRQIEADPAKAVPQLQAFVDLFDADELEEADRQILAVAQEQLKEFETLRSASHTASRRLLEKRLAHAQKLVPANPQQAERIYRAVIQLTEDRPWAKELHETAQAGIQALQGQP